MPSESSVTIPLEWHHFLPIVCFLFICSQIVDPDTNKVLGPNERGEVCARGPQIMKGYLNNMAATHKTVDFDGWIHTG